MAVSYNASVKFPYDNNAPLSWQQSLYKQQYVEELKLQKDFFSRLMLTECAVTEDWATVPQEQHEAYAGLQEIPICTI